MKCDNCGRETSIWGGKSHSVGDMEVCPDCYENNYEEVKAKAEESENNYQTENEQEIETSINESGNKEQPQNSKKPRLAFAIIFYGLAGVLLIVGLATAYQESNYETEIVGGDAYNYIIFTTRGVVWVGSAICSSIIGLAFQLGNFKKELLDSN